LTLFATALEIPPDWFSSRHDRAKGVSGSITRLLYYPAIPHQTAGSNTNSGGRVEGEEQARQDDDIRAGAHSDYGSITLLFQLPGQPGLQILSEKTGEWSSVPVDPLHDCNMTTTNNNNNTTMKTQKRPLPILVNIGDLLSYWTNNLLKSTIHRVVFPRPEMKIGNGKGGQDDEEEEKSHDRYSMAYFCHPCDDAELIPVPSELVRRHGSSSSSSSSSIGKGMQKQDTTMTAKDHLLQRLAATYGKN
jgi:isopenicillin N synthase-like dioxygenase